MPQINRSALMPYAPETMYKIVNNVASYADFLPWCGGVKIHFEEELSMEASILLRGAGLNHWFKTRNIMKPGKTIQMSLREGPFGKLEGLWQFTKIDTDGCKIEFLLDFEMKQGITTALLAPAFSRIANTMVDSFCDRARELNSV